MVPAGEEGKQEEIHGASEQYICSLISSFNAKGWKYDSVISSGLRKRINCEPVSGKETKARHSSKTKRLKERMARISACQSWRTIP